MRGDMGADNEFTDFSKPWKESRIEVPPPPEDKDLLEIPVDVLSEEFTLYIDQRNLNVGEDNVVRYWLVLRTGRGANNVFYEGLRCRQREYKTYAYASTTRKGKVREVKKPRWQAIYTGKDFRGEMMEYLCNDVVPRTPERIVAAIKGSGVPVSDFFAPSIGTFQR